MDEVEVVRKWILVWYLIDIEMHFCNKRLFTRGIWSFKNIVKPNLIEGMRRFFYTIFSVLYAKKPRANSRNINWLFMKTPSARLVTFVHNC